MVNVNEIDWGECRGKPMQDALQKFEGALGRAVPGTLRSLLDIANAGSPSYDIFRYRDPETHQSIRSCLGALISFDARQDNNVIEYLTNPSEGMSYELVPFAVVGNGNLICLKRETDGVFLWLHGNRPGFDEYQLAGSVQEFLEALERDDDDEEDDLDIDGELAELDEEYTRDNTS